MHLNHLSFPCRDVEWPATFHFGFEVPSVEELGALYERLSGAGTPMRTTVTQHVRGSRFFCEAPGGLLIEVNTRADAHETYRRSFT